MSFIEHVCLYVCRCYYRAELTITTILVYCSLTVAESPIVVVESSIVVVKSSVVVVESSVVVVESSVVVITITAASTVGNIAP